MIRFVTDANNMSVMLGGIRFQSKEMMMAMGLQLVARIKLRTQKGQKPRGGRLKKYSTTPLTKPIMGRIVAKGGTSRTASSIFYKRGYKQFKKDSTGRSKVDYMLSGATMKAMRVTSATWNVANCGFGTQEAKQISSLLQDRDPFFLIGKGDERALIKIARWYQRSLTRRFNANRRARPPLKAVGITGIVRTLSGAFSGRAGGGRSGGVRSGGGANRFRGTVQR